MRAGLEKGSRLLLLLLLGLQLPIGAGSVGETAAGLRGLTYTVALKPGARQAQRHIRPAGAAVSAAVKPETVRMMDQQGRAYTCELPPQPVLDSASSTRASTSPSSLSPVIAPGGLAGRASVTSHGCEYCRFYHGTTQLGLHQEECGVVDIRSVSWR